MCTGGGYRKNRKEEKRNDRGIDGEEEEYKIMRRKEDEGGVDGSEEKANMCMRE